MAKAPSQARLIAAVHTLTGGRLRWISVNDVAAELGVEYEAAALAVGKAKVAGLVDLAGMPPHSVMLTDEGRRAVGDPSKV